MKKKPKKLLRPHTITSAASKVSSIPIGVIRGKSRVGSVVAVRDLCLKLCKENMFTCDRDLGLYFNRQRSSISYALIRVEDHLDQSLQYQLMLQMIKEELGIVEEHINKP